MAITIHYIPGYTDKKKQICLNVLLVTDRDFQSLYVIDKLYSQNIR